MADVIAREWAYLGGSSSVRKRTLTQRPICNQHSLAHTGTLFTTAHTHTHTLPVLSFPLTRSLRPPLSPIAVATRFSWRQPFSWNFQGHQAWSLSHIHLGDHIWPSRHRLHTKRAHSSLPSPQTNQPPYHAGVTGTSPTLGLEELYPRLHALCLWPCALGLLEWWRTLGESTVATHTTVFQTANSPAT